ncbi:hypothetical protein EHS25_000935 [Saitozyma podzolica]|uniref:Uncharacterized protein n=1 Tax=Saitozyma podzolica TaxID=1890683 RepID=A0A427YXN8_9TREE|nr:hypothetical protein EHS25_000935 [Saitozyma podzolica]
MFYVHFFMLGHPDAREYHGAAIPPQLFRGNLAHRPNKDLTRWHTFNAPRLIFEIFRRAWRSMMLERNLTGALILKLNIRLNPAKFKILALEMIQTNGLRMLGTCVGAHSVRERFLLAKIDHEAATVAKLINLPHQHALLVLRVGLRRPTDHPEATLISLPIKMGILSYKRVAPHTYTASEAADDSLTPILTPEATYHSTPTLPGAKSSLRLTDFEGGAALQLRILAGERKAHCTNCGEANFFGHPRGLASAEAMACGPARGCQTASVCSGAELSGRRM